MRPNMQHNTTDINANIINENNNSIVIENDQNSIIIENDTHQENIEVRYFSIVARYTLINSGYLEKEVKNLVTEEINAFPNSKKLEFLKEHIMQIYKEQFDTYEFNLQHNVTPQGAILYVKVISDTITKQLYEISLKMTNNSEPFLNKKVIDTVIIESEAEGALTIEKVTLDLFLDAYNRLKRNKFKNQVYIEPNIYFILMQNLLNKVSNICKLLTVTKLGITINQKSNSLIEVLNKVNSTLAHLNTLDNQNEKYNFTMEKLREIFGLFISKDSLINSVKGTIWGGGQPPVVTTLYKELNKVKNSQWQDFLNNPAGILEAIDKIIDKKYPIQQFENIITFNEKDVPSINDYLFSL